MNNSGKILFHPSSMGKIMTNDRSGKQMGDTCKKHLMEVFAEHKYHRKEEISSKYLTHGNRCENDSITLLSRVTTIFFKKNELQIENDDRSEERRVGKECRSRW